jgi:hypothetical protein
MVLILDKAGKLPLISISIISLDILKLYSLTSYKAGRLFKY